VDIPLKQYWGLLARHIKPQMQRFLLLTVLLLSNIGLQLANPQIVRVFIDTAIAGEGRETLAYVALAFVHNLFNGVQMRDPLTGMRVVRSEILKNWTPKSKSFDVEVELNHHVEREGYGIIEIPIHYRRRLGQKKLAVRHGLTILKRILLESTY